MRTSAGMSPGLSAPSSECTSTPSQTSIAILARYSCERCIGLRVWNAAIVVQPSEVNSARVSAGVMNSAPYCSANPPVDSTLIGPGEVHVALLRAPSSRPGARGRSCGTSSRTRAPCRSRTSPSPASSPAAARRRDRRARSRARCGSSRRTPAPADSVIGIGQNSPLAVFMPSQTPCQSACVMKPSSGVKPPMPSMTMSPFSRELTVSRGSVAARRRSASSAAPARRSGRRSRPPCGSTRAMAAFSSQAASGAGAGAAAGPCASCCRLDLTR